ncbi:PLP-dependent aminotransferase family protein [Mesorhizobium loti]|nr:PLP-dependent aminotransferase family protein [Mesorhizobium jarvisii]QKD12254.1 PLP-dependent aminotransferase family protein [Mesorhizobium loti]
MSVSVAILDYSMWIPDLSNSVGPRYKAIIDAVDRAIASKALQPGDRLPTHRELAEKLGVSVQTVARAYAEAARKGLLSGEVGRGTFVQYFRPEQRARCFADSEEPNVRDFSNIVPVLSEIHIEVLREAMVASAKDGAIQRMLEYRPTQGIAQHREAGAAWLERNGVQASADRVIVTNGVAHAIWTAMASITEPGDVVATESLVDTSITINASILKVRLRGLAIDHNGIIPESFEEACAHENIKVLCITPCYSAPTVSLMDEARRERIAEIARRHDVAIIEDDVFGPLIPKRPKPMWCFAPERTYYATSFTKCVMPTLRTGFLAGPVPAIPRLTSRVRATGWSANIWTADVAARWLQDGTIDRLIEWQRQKLKTRYEILNHVLGAYSYEAEPYAMHAWLSLPEHWRSSHFVDHARSLGLLVSPPDPFIIGRAVEPHAVRLALGDTNRNDQDFKDGLERIAALLQEDPDPMSIPY